MALKLLNSNLFELAGAPMWLHLGTAANGMKEYICFVNIITNQCYCERFEGTQLVSIENDNEFEDVARFFTEQGISDLKRVSIYMSKKRADSLAKGQ